MKRNLEWFMHRTKGLGVEQLNLLAAWQKMDAWLLKNMGGEVSPVRERINGVLGMTPMAKEDATIIVDALESLVTMLRPTRLHRIEAWSLYRGVLIQLICYTADQSQNDLTYRLRFRVIQLVKTTEIAVANTECLA